MSTGLMRAALCSFLIRVRKTKKGVRIFLDKLTEEESLIIATSLFSAI